MNAILSLDEAGRLVLPTNALRLPGMKAADAVRAERDAWADRSLPR
jgi:hypothetical protein